MLKLFLWFTDLKWLKKIVNQDYRARKAPWLSLFGWWQRSYSLDYCDKHENKLPHRCSAGSLFRLHVVRCTNASNCSLPPPFLSRWKWAERDGCSFRLFEWLHDFHTLPLNLMLRRCSELEEHWAGPKQTALICFVFFFSGHFIAAEA